MKTTPPSLHLSFRIYIPLILLASVCGIFLPITMTQLFYMIAGIGVIPLIITLCTARGNILIGRIPRPRSYIRWFMSTLILQICWLILMHIFFITAPHPTTPSLIVITSSWMAYIAIACMLSLYIYHHQRFYLIQHTVAMIARMFKNAHTREQFNMTLNFYWLQGAFFGISTTIAYLSYVLLTHLSTLLKLPLQTGMQFKTFLMISLVLLAMASRAWFRSIRWIVARQWPLSSFLIPSIGLTMLLYLLLPILMHAITLPQATADVLLQAWLPIAKTPEVNSNLLYSAWIWAITPFISLTIAHQAQGHTLRTMLGMQLLSLCVLVVGYWFLLPYLKTYTTTPVILGASLVLFTGICLVLEFHAPTRSVLFTPVNAASCRKPRRQFNQVRTLLQSTIALFSLFIIAANLLPSIIASAMVIPMLLVALGMTLNYCLYLKVPQI